MFLSREAKSTMSKSSNMVYKTLVVSFIICFILMSPSAFAISELSSDNVELCDSHPNIGNNPPDVPTIDGPLGGKLGVELCYIFQSIDPDDDDVMYIIDWDDGTFTETNYYQHDLPIEVCHTWYRAGTYFLRCKAKDVYGGASEWRTLCWPGLTISGVHYDLCLFEVKGNVSKSSKWQEPIFFIGKWFNRNNRYKFFISALLVIVGDKNEETLLIQDLIDEDMSDIYYGNIEIEIKLIIGVINPSESIYKGFFYRATVY